MSLDNLDIRVRLRSPTARAHFRRFLHSQTFPYTPNHLSLAFVCLEITLILGCALAVRLREGAFSPVFVQSAIRNSFGLTVHTRKYNF